jgi:hypothetical protein
MAKWSQEYIRVVYFVPHALVPHNPSNDGFDFCTMRSDFSRRE